MVAIHQEVDDDLDPGVEKFRGQDDDHGEHHDRRLQRRGLDPEQHDADSRGKGQLDPEGALGAYSIAQPFRRVGQGLRQGV